MKEITIRILLGFLSGGFLGGLHLILMSPLWFIMGVGIDWFDDFQIDNLVVASLVLFLAGGAFGLFYGGILFLIVCKRTLHVPKKKLFAVFSKYTLIYPVILFWTIVLVCFLVSRFLLGIEGDKAYYLPYNAVFMFWFWLAPAIGFLFGMRALAKEDKPNE